MEKPCLAELVREFQNLGVICGVRNAVMILAYFIGGMGQGGQPITGRAGCGP
jgi:hypothetical protein